MKDYEKLNELINEHLKVAIPKFCKANNLIQRKLAKVAEVSGNTARVYFPPDFITKSIFYPNQSGASLNIGDWVYIYCDFGNEDQGWIVKKK